MKLRRVRIHNYRSIIDAEIEAHDFTMLVGANNAGKSNFMNALRCFYGDIRWTDNDFPKVESSVEDQESWIELSFDDLTDNEWNTLDEKYKAGVKTHSLVLKRYFKGEKVKSKQSNIYAVVNAPDNERVFYGANTVSATKCGKIVYIPALTTPDDQMKTTGPSPLRDMLSLMLDRFIPQSEAYGRIGEALNELNREANSDHGFLSRIAQPINDALRQWDVQIDLSVNPISTDVILKSLISYTFSDTNIHHTEFGLDRFGHGFQRAVIYELLRLSSQFRANHTTSKSEFDPDFTLLLFEEPEAFLHPAQQENMAYHLRQFGQEPGQQVIITSHSPVFVSKNGDDLGHICRIQKHSGISHIYQLNNIIETQLFDNGENLLNLLNKYAIDSKINEDTRKNAQILINYLNTEKGSIEINNQYERFRFQLWLDSDRASMFFADKVLLVEGTSEKALFNYLLANEWHDLARERVLVIDALGKYNFHRFISLFEAYGIRYGVILDDDQNDKIHAVLNLLIRDWKAEFRLSEPSAFDEDLECFLGLPHPKNQKPIHILKALEDGSITEEHIRQLREIFCKALAIQTNRDH
jgi:predicted ATP-dependent endonuclease of OLD family